MADLTSEAVLAARANDPASDWKAAVRGACTLLSDRDAVTAEYAERCIDAVEQHGPYFVLAPGIALAHASPEAGVRRLGISVVTLAEGVRFGHPDNDPVDVVFAFGSPDREQHVGLLSRLANALLAGLADRLRRAGEDAAALALLEEVARDG